MLWSPELPVGPRWFNDVALARWGETVRVADFITKCAVFIGQTIKGEFRPLGTAFFVGYPVQNGACQYLITAQHIIANKADLQIRLNTRNGRSQIFDLPSDKWIYHQNPMSIVDVAAQRTAIPYIIYDIEQISLRKEMVTEQIIERWNMGVGDEVFFPGLFVPHSGQGRNLPIVRSGTIAAMPSEPVKLNNGSMPLYLIEARSIGGHSGSPVFVNMLAPRSHQTEKPQGLPLPGERRDYYFLGLIRGHLRTTDAGEYTVGDAALGNSGIATVIPAQDIWDVLDQPELEEERMEAWRASHKDSADHPDSVAPIAPGTKAESADENPDHREDFNRLVSAASKSKPKGDRT